MLIAPHPHPSFAWIIFKIHKRVFYDGKQETEIYAHVSTTVELQII